MLGLQEIRISVPAADTPSQPKKRKKAALSSPNFTDIVKAILPDYDTICEAKGAPAFAKRAVVLSVMSCPPS